MGEFVTINMDAGRAIGAGEAGFEVTGLVKWFDSTKGYGFIKPSTGLRGDVLLHQTCVRQSGFTAAYEGAKVVCEAIQGPKGLQARRVLSLDNSTAVAPLPAQRHTLHHNLFFPERAVLFFRRLGRSSGFRI